MSYPNLFSRIKKLYSGFPDVRRPVVGAVLKALRINRGMRQIDFSQHARLNLSTLKSIENDHQKATTVSNLQACACLLDHTLEQIITLGREKDPANYFVLKTAPHAKVPGRRYRKKESDPWFHTRKFIYQKAEVTPLTPPLATPRDFMMLKIRLPAGTHLRNLSLGHEGPVIVFLSQGFEVKILSQDAVRSESPLAILNANQGASFHGGIRHSILNSDPGTESVFYLITHLSKSQPSSSRKRTRLRSPVQNFDIASGIETLRRCCSPSPDRLLSLRQLAEITETLTHEQISKLMRVKKGSSVIYWEKIEELLAGAQVSMEEFLGWCRGRPLERTSRVSSLSRTLMDHNAHFGVKIYSATPPGLDNRFFCGELFFEPHSAGKKIWERKDAAMIALDVMAGELEISVGKNRGPITLSKNESIYFDGSLGYGIRNPGKVQAMAFLASFPGIQI